MCHKMFYIYSCFRWGVGNRFHCRYRGFVELLVGCVGGRYCLRLRRLGRLLLDGCGGLLLGCVGVVGLGRLGGLAIFCARFLGVEWRFRGIGCGRLLCSLGCGWPLWLVVRRIARGRMGGRLLGSVFGAFLIPSERCRFASRFLGLGFGDFGLLGVVGIRLGGISSMRLFGVGFRRHIGRGCLLS